jgi:hypothetical protein
MTLTLRTTVRSKRRGKRALCKRCRYAARFLERCLADFAALEPKIGAFVRLKLDGVSVAALRGLHVPRGSMLANSVVTVFPTMTAFAFVARETAVV